MVFEPAIFQKKKTVLENEFVLHWGGGFNVTSFKTLYSFSGTGL